MTKLHFEDAPEAQGHSNILGDGTAGTHAGDMIVGEIALTIEMGSNAVYIGTTIYTLRLRMGWPSPPP